MPKGPRGEIRPRDVSACAVHVAKLATGELSETIKPPPARAPKRAVGGKARAASLTPERRTEIARKAAAARWK